MLNKAYDNIYDIIVFNYIGMDIGQKVVSGTKCGKVKMHKLAKC